MNFSQHDFVRHGVVLVQTIHPMRFDLFRGGQVFANTDEVVAGNERWSLDQHGHEIVFAMDPEGTRFRGEAGEIYVLEKRWAWYAELLPEVFRERYHRVQDG